MWPCDELVTPPGCTPPFTQDLDPSNPVQPERDKEVEDEWISLLLPLHYSVPALDSSFFWPLSNRENYDNELKIDLNLPENCFVSLALLPGFTNVHVLSLPRKMFIFL